jgi:L-histidine Nalpha-methyltransferase
MVEMGAGTRAGSESAAALTVIDRHPPAPDVLAAVREGLARRPRQLPAWLLYDRRGSELFAEICRQPEYTLTATELSLLRRHAAALCAGCPPGTLVVEFGAGSVEKVSPLLQALATPAYLAIDISASALQAVGRRLQAAHPSVPMLGLCADYGALPDLPLPADWGTRPRLGFFPGSSLGNFDPAEACRFLAGLLPLLGPRGQLLIGIDQPRDPAAIEAAYDDRAGVTAAFELNVLHRLRRELGAEVDPEGFRYRASWEADRSRVAMALVSIGRQRVRLPDLEVVFADGEPLITEYSYKYAPAAFLGLAARAGWQGIDRRCDDADGYSVHRLQPLVAAPDCSTSAD